MAQSLTIGQLHGAVNQLVSAGRHLDALNVVFAFMDKGATDFAALKSLVTVFSQYDDIASLKEIEMRLQRQFAGDERTTRLCYLIRHGCRDWKGAEKYLKPLVQKNLSEADLRIALANLQEKQLRPKEAVTTLDHLEMLSLSSEDLARMCYVKASALVQLKETEEAKVFLLEYINNLEDSRYSAGCWKLLGRIYDKADAYDKAFDAFDRGNTILREQEAPAITENPARQRVEVMRALYQKEWVSGWKDTGGDDPAPVFLVGFPRSGTTLLEQVLDSHPKIQALEERATIEQTYRIAGIMMSAMAGKALKKHPSSNWKQRSLLVNEQLANLNTQQLSILRKTYWAEVAKYVEIQRGRTFLDKMPLNMSLVGFIHRLFPNARFIVALRHPCDCVLSAFMQSFDMNPAMANMVSLDWGASYYQHLMSLLWQYEQVLPLEGKMRYLKYEDLITNFDQSAKEILDFIGVGWSDNVREYDKHARERGTLGTPSYMGVTQKLYTGAMDRWRRYDPHLRPVMEHFSVAAKRYGYNLE